MHTIRPSRRSVFVVAATACLLLCSTPVLPAGVAKRPVSPAAADGGGAIARPASRPGVSPVRCLSIRRCV